MTRWIGNTRYFVRYWTVRQIRARGTGIRSGNMPVVHACRPMHTPRHRQFVVDSERFVATIVFTSVCGHDFMAKMLLPDELWLLIEPNLPAHRPSPRGSRPRIDDKAALIGIRPKDWHTLGVSAS